MAERTAHNRLVEGSNPSGPTICRGFAPNLDPDTPVSGSFFIDLVQIWANCFGINVHLGRWFYEYQVGSIKRLEVLISDYGEYNDK